MFIYHNCDWLHVDVEAYASETNRYIINSQGNSNDKTKIIISEI